MMSDIDSGETSSKGVIMKVIGVASIVLIVGVAIFAINTYFDSKKNRQEEETCRRETVKTEFLELIRSSSEANSSSSNEAPEQSNSSDNVKSTIAFADDSISNKTDVDKALDKLKRAKNNAKGEDLTVVVSKINELNETKEKEIARLIAQLRTQARALAKMKKYHEAAGVFKNYDPPKGKKYLADATRTERLKEASQYEMQAEKIKTKQLQSKQEEVANKRILMASIVPLLAHGKYAEAYKAFNYNPNSVKYPDIKKILESLIDVENIILESFKQDIGKIVVVHHHGKKQRLKIKYVENGRIMGEDKVGEISVGVKMKVDDLGFSEIASRLKKMNPIAQNIYLGVEKLKDKDYDDAKTFFSKTDYFAQPLTAQISDIKNSTLESSARSALGSIIKKADGKCKSTDPKEILAKLGNTSFSGKKAKYMLKYIKEFKEKYGSTQISRQYSTVIEKINALAESGLKNQAPAPSPSQKADQKTKETPRLSKKIKTREDLYRALKVFNPDYELNGEIKNTDKSFNIQLQETNISDITPLKGLDITELDISKTGVSDLSPLKKCKDLRKLNIIDTKVTSLEPLKGLRLVEIGFDPAAIKNPDEVRNLRKMKTLKTITTPKGEIELMKFWIRFDAGDFK